MAGTVQGDARGGLGVAERVRACLEQVCDGITAGPEEVCGLGEDVIREIEEDQPAPLSEAYRCFLQVAGGGAGRFLQGSEVFHPDVIGLRKAAEELLAESGLVLEDTDRVILMHQRSQFDFTRGLGADPEIWSCSEGGVPRPVYSCFTDWLQANVDEQTGAWARLASWCG